MWYKVQLNYHKYLIESNVGCYLNNDLIMVNFLHQLTCLPHLKQKVGKFKW